MKSPIKYFLLSPAANNSAPVGPHMALKNWPIDKIIRAWWAGRKFSPKLLTMIGSEYRTNNRNDW